MERRLTPMIAALGIVLCVPVAAIAQGLTIWHAYGDQGLNTLQRIAESYSHDHPGVTMKSVSMSREQWLARSIAALSTSTAPDIVFYDNDLMVQVEKSTGKLTDLTVALYALPVEARAFVSAGDIRGSSFGNKLIMMPVNRAIVGLGARKTWLAEVGEAFPRTWDDFLRVAEKFKNAKGGYPIGLHAGTPAAITYAGIDLFAYGNGAPHTQVDANGNIIIDQPYVATPLIGYLKLFTQYRLVSPETTNYTYVELNQMVEAGKVGLFRIGNWSVAKWDKDPPAGDYEVGPFPSFGGGTGAMIVSTIRGMAVPENAPHKDVALEFVKYALSQPAQQAFLDLFGGAIRTDLDTSHVTSGLRPFLAKDLKLQTDDFASAKFPWFGKMQEAYYRLLLDAISNPPQDWNAWVKDTAAKMRVTVEELKKG